MLRGRMRLARGDTTGAQDDAERALDCRASREGSAGPVARARIRGACVQCHRSAHGLVRSLPSSCLTGDALGWPRTSESDWPADISLRSAATRQRGQFLDGAAQPRTHTPWFEALSYAPRATSAGPRTCMRGSELVPDEASARLCAAEALVREGRRAEADVELNLALAFWRSVGATAYVREAEALLAAAG